MIQIKPILSLHPSPLAGAFTNAIGNSGLLHPLAGLCPVFIRPVMNQVELKAATPFHTLTTY